MSDKLKSLLGTTVRDICKVPNSMAKSQARKAIEEYAVTFARECVPEPLPVHTKKSCAGCRNKLPCMLEDNNFGFKVAVDKMEDNITRLSGKGDKKFDDIIQADHEEVVRMHATIIFKENGKL
jgi:hypothetical protein